MKQATKKSAGLALVLLMAGIAAGCTTARMITAESWWADGTGVYVGYWQGPFWGGRTWGKGESKLEWCKLDPSVNSLGCRAQESAEKALNIRGRDKADKQ